MEGSAVKKMMVVDACGKRKGVECSDHPTVVSDTKCKAIVDADTGGVMVMQLNDCTEGPTEVSSYYIQIIKGRGLKKSVYRTLKDHASAGRWYFESVTSEGFCGLLDEDDDNFDSLVEDFGLFIETHMIPANLMGKGVVDMPDMSKIKFVVNYTVE